MGCVDKPCWKRAASGGLNYGKVPDYWLRRMTPQQKALLGGKDASTRLTTPTKSINK